LTPSALKHRVHFTMKFWIFVGRDSERCSIVREWRMGTIFSTMWSMCPHMEWCDTGAVLLNMQMTIMGP
jgi:hypothetical protein